MTTSYDKGVRYEEMSEKYLIKQGYEIITRRYKTKYGEIDLIAKQTDTICFIEVKYRKNAPEYALTEKQMRRIIDAANTWIAENYQTNQISMPCMRFDVICISLSDLQHFTNAFTLDI